MYYYIEKKDNKLIGKLESKKEITLDSFIEVTKEEYDNIKLPFIVNSYENIQDVLLLQSLEPSKEDIQKAENTIEILSILEEVGLI